MNVIRNKKHRPQSLCLYFLRFTNHLEPKNMRPLFAYLAFFAAFLAPLTATAGHHEEAVVSGQKPFVLIARLHSLPSKSAEVLRLSKAADIAVKSSEPGMLLHTFDQDPGDPLGFVWTEVYENSAALIFHLENPPLQQYLGEVSPLLDSFTVELYGDVSEEAVNLLRSTGTPTVHYESKFGYIRDLTP